MNLPQLGRAIIINNVAEEMKGSMEDVKALKIALQTVGFDVDVHVNLTKVVSHYKTQAPLSFPRNVVNSAN